MESKPCKGPSTYYIQKFSDFVPPPPLNAYIINGWPLFNVPYRKEEIRDEISISNRRILYFRPDQHKRHVTLVGQSNFQIRAQIENIPTVLHPDSCLLLFHSSAPGGVSEKTGKSSGLSLKKYCKALYRITCLDSIPPRYARTTSSMQNISIL